MKTRSFAFSVAPRVRQCASVKVSMLSETAKRRRHLEVGNAFVLLPLLGVSHTRQQLLLVPLKTIRLACLLLTKRCFYRDFVFVCLRHLVVAQQLVRLVTLSFDLHSADPSSYRAPCTSAKASLCTTGLNLKIGSKIRFWQYGICEKYSQISPLKGHFCGGLLLNAFDFRYFARITR